MTETAEEKPRRIWPFVIAATVLAILIALIATGATISSIRLPDGDETYRAGYLAGAVAARAFGSTFVVWLIFYFFFFRSRAGIGKSLGALAIMAVFAIAAPLTLVSFANARVAAQTQAPMEASAARVGALAGKLNADIAALNLSAEQGIHSHAQVASWLERLRQAAILMEEHDRALDQEHDRVIAELYPDARAVSMPDLILDIYSPGLGGDVRTQRLIAIRRAIGATGPSRLALRGRIAETHKAMELLTLLADNPDAWTAEDGAPVFRNAQLLVRYEALSAELAAARTERERLDLAAQPEPAD